MPKNEANNSQSGEPEESSQPLFKDPAFRDATLKALTRAFIADPMMFEGDELEDPAEEARYRQFLNRFLAESYAALKEPFEEDLVDAIDISETDFARYVQAADQLTPAIVSTLRCAYVERFQDNAYFHKMTVAFLAKLGLYWPTIVSKFQSKIDDQAAAIVQTEQHVQSLTDEIKKDPEVLIQQILRTFDDEEISESVEDDIHRAAHKALYEVIERWLTPQRLDEIVKTSTTEEADVKSAVPASETAPLETQENVRVLRLDRHDQELVRSLLNLEVVRAELGLKSDCTLDEIERLRALLTQLEASSDSTK